MTRLASVLLVVSACAPVASRGGETDSPMRTCPVPPPRGALVVDTVDGARGDVAGTVASTAGEASGIAIGPVIILSRGDTVRAAESGDNRFRFRGIPPGRHELLVQSLSFYPRRASIDVPANGALQLMVPLDPSPTHWCEQPMIVPRG